MFLLILVGALGEIVALIPRAALVAVMVFVSVVTFDRRSIRPSTLRMMPKSETTVMLATSSSPSPPPTWPSASASGSSPPWSSSPTGSPTWSPWERCIEEHFVERIAKYEVNGKLFCASSNDRYTQFEYVEDPDRVVLDMCNSHLWDASTIASLDAITAKYAKYGKTGD